MITTAEEYNKYKYLLSEHKNTPIAGIRLPSDETIYNIDLNKRTIEAPEFLSVTTDHYAETIYFKADRYFDNMDLTNTICVVQFVNENAKDEEGKPAGGYIYPVPFYDVDTIDPENKNKILIPWCIAGPATAAAGPITFSIRFYLLDSEKKDYLYNLSTMPAQSKILHGMDITKINDNNDNYHIFVNQYDDIISHINDIKTNLETTIYWIDV
jgi:hypothetical protein